MKKYFLANLCFAIIFVVCSCVNLEKLHNYPPVKTQMADRYLQEINNMVDVNFIVKLDQVYANWHDGIKIIPTFYQDQTKRLELKPLIIEGVQHDIFNDRMEKFDATYFDKIDARNRYTRENMAVQYNTSVQYAQWMKNAALYADVYANAYKREIYLGRVLITNGLFDLSSLISFDSFRKYYYQTDFQNRIVRGGKESVKDQSIIFRLNSSNLEADKIQEKNFEQFLQSLRMDPEVKGYDLSVSVSSSPEGSVKHNQALSESRLQTVKEYLAAIGEQKYSSEIVAEGWDRLISLLPGAKIQNRAEIENIIRTTPDPDERERLIRTKYSADYRVLLNDIFPLLRYGDVAVTIQYKGAEGVSYMHSTENIYLNGEKSEINSFVKLSGKEDQIAALHNRMLDAIKEGNTSLAKSLAEQIPANVRSEVIRYNKALMLMDEARYDEAKAIMATINSIPEAKYALGVVQLMHGEYKSANQNLNEYIDINAAIAKICVDDNKNAIGILLLLPKSPERDYLLAIANARINEPEKAKEFLDAATSASQTLKQKAVFEPDFNAFNN